ncbi:MAG TPA: PilN domain-containing protein [Hyphomicrobiaceae bacterium]|nr:PilN domain-containing protein [Hyphomicrobiaceae bacterium]
MASIAQGLGVAAGSVTNFLGWWREELRGLVPQRVRARAASQILIVVGQDGYRVLESTGSKQRPVRGGVELSAPEAAAAAAELAKSNAAALIGIRVPLASCFVRHVELPRSAQADVARILELDLERATPFKLKDVLCAALIEDGQERAGRLKVRHMMIKRQTLEPISAELNASAVAVDFIDCWDEVSGQPLTVNFLASQQQAAAAGRKVSFTALLMGLAALLGIAAIWLADARYQTALEGIEGQVAQARTQATNVRRALDTSQAAIVEIGQLQSLKLGTTTTVELIDAVTKLLPNSVWLTDLRLENGQLDITGLAKSGAALLPLFERSPLFTDAAMASGVNFDPQENKERFSLRVRVRQAAGEAAAGNDQEKR